MKILPSVSIIFPNYNGGKEPLECIKSIYKLNYSKDNLEIIVIDNGSTDGSGYKIKEKYPHVTVIRISENIGFARAVNKGIKKSTSEYIFIGNDDILFEKNSLLKMVEYSRNHPDVGVLGGKIFYKSAPWKICSAGYYMNKWTGNVYPSPDSQKMHEPDWVQGCALLVQRTLFNSIGLLDEDFVLLFDDFDLCMRAKKKGFKVVYLPTAIFWHGESLTVDTNKPNKYFHWYKSKLRFIIKHFSVVNIISIMFLQLFIVMPYRTLVLRDERLIPFVKGLLWNIIHLAQTLSERKKLQVIYNP